MQSYEFKVKVPGTSPKDAEQKLKALLFMASKLETDVVVGFARVVRDEPGKIQQARSYFNF